MFCPRARVFALSACLVAVFAMPAHAFLGFGGGSKKLGTFENPDAITFTNFQYAWQSALTQLPCGWASVRPSASARANADFTCVGGQWATVRLMIDRKNTKSDDLKRVRLLWRAWDPSVNPAGGEAYLANDFLRHVVLHYVPKDQAEAVTRAFFAQKPEEWRSDYVKIRYKALPENGYVLHRLEIVGTGAPSSVATESVIEETKKDAEKRARKLLELEEKPAPAFKAAPLPNINETALQTEILSPEPVATSILQVDMGLPAEAALDVPAARLEVIESPSVYVEEPQQDGQWVAPLAPKVSLDAVPAVEMPAENTQKNSWFNRFKQDWLNGAVKGEESPEAQEVVGQSTSGAVLSVFQQQTQPAPDLRLNVPQNTVVPAVEIVLPEDMAAPRTVEMPNATKNMASKNDFNTAYEATKALTQPYEAAVEWSVPAAMQRAPVVPRSAQTAEENTFMDFRPFDDSQWALDLGVQGGSDVPVGLPLPAPLAADTFEDLDASGL